MDLTYAIALTMLPQVGSNSARQLLEMFETPEKVFHLSHSQLSKVFNKHENIINAITDPALLHKAENELAFCEKEGIRVLYFTDPDYPQRLNSPDCEDTPVLLYYIGSANLNKERVISIVGTRRATEYGRSNTELLVNGMKQEEVLIVSGLALGIDSAAHRAALANMLPTVAVVAHGLEQIYPPQNRDLAKRIVQSGGGIITEYPHGTAINPGMFPARNRIIAALSDATVVVEASVKGGALITANIANGYHRDVLTFPGRVGDTYSAGCNRIIASNKAQLIENSDDLFASLSWERKYASVGIQTQLPLDLPPDELAILSILHRADNALTMEELQEKSNFTLPKISTLLLGMELKNLVRALPGNRYKSL